MPAGSGRSIFALPWLGHTLIGTTDNDYEGPLDHVEPSGEDIDYLLDAVNEFFGTRLSAPTDLTGAFAGVRPLISTGDPKKSVDISRKAELYETSSGMITITGGKLTTWRRMAKMTVDRLVERDARDAPCRTHEIPLGQADRRRGAAARGGRAPRTPTRRSPPATATPPTRCSRSRPSAASWPSRSCPGCPDLLAEVALAARREQARSIGDVLLRRTRLGLLAARELGAGRRTAVAARGGGARARARLGRGAGWRRARRVRRRGGRRGHRCRARRAGAVRQAGAVERVPACALPRGAAIASSSSARARC